MQTKPMDGYTGSDTIRLVSYRGGVVLGHSPATTAPRAAGRAAVAAVAVAAAAAEEAAAALNKPSQVPV
jgi:hypothetical protein